MVRSTLRDLMNRAIAREVPDGTTFAGIKAWQAEVREWVAAGFGEHEAVRLIDYSGMNLSGVTPDNEVRGFRNRLRELSDRMDALPVRMAFPVRKYRA